MPERFCIGCRKVQDRTSMFRILKNAENLIFIDPSPYEFGRSFYICKNKSCLEKAKKHKRYKDLLNTLPLRLS